MPGDRGESSSRETPARKRSGADLRLRSLAGFAVIVAAAVAAFPVAAYDVVGYTAAANNRFSSGFPTAPVTNTSGSFVGLAYSWLGVGWATSDPTKGFGFLTPKHYLVAKHYGGAATINLLAAGGQVIWLNWGVRADRLNLPAGVLFKAKVDAQGQLTGVGYAESSPLDRGPSLVPGHWGAQVVDELPVAADDITVFKHRLSGFYDNELDSLLRQQGVKTLLFAGINTDRCVFSSLQDAGFLGYDCVLLEDACATPSPAYVSRAILFLVEKLHGFVASAQSLTVSLTPKGARS
jgi:nicotinamidase-related amidase